MIEIYIVDLKLIKRELMRPVKRTYTSSRRDRVSSQVQQGKEQTRQRIPRYAIQLGSVCHGLLLKTRIHSAYRGMKCQAHAGEISGRQVSSNVTLFGGNRTNHDESK